MINRSKKAKKLLVSKKKLALNIRLGNDSLRTITLRKAFRRDFSKHWNDSQDYTNNSETNILANSQWETPQEASHAARAASQTALDATEKATGPYRPASWTAASEANEYAKMAHAHSVNPSMHSEALKRHEKALQYHQEAANEHSDVVQSRGIRAHLHADARDAHLEAVQVHRDAISEYRDRGVITNSQWETAQEASVAAKGASEEAYNATEKAGSYTSFAASDARRHANVAHHLSTSSIQGAHPEALWRHETAARYHEAAAQEHDTTAEVSTNKHSHQAAAQLHREAAILHRDAASEYKDRGITDNALTPAKKQALEISRTADEHTGDTMFPYHEGSTEYRDHVYYANRASWNARDEAHQGYSDNARHWHEEAIIHHTKASETAPNEERAELHRRAAVTHSIARDAHEDAVNNVKYNPDEPRDKLGKWTKLSSATHATLKSLKSLHHGVEHLEERTKSKVSHLMTKGVTKLPSHIQGLVHGISKALRGGTKLLFANWSMVQRFSDRVAQARGLSPEQSAKIHGVLSSIDLKTFEVFKVGSLLGAHSFHIPAIVTGTLPIATTGYLAWNTVKTGGLAPARAALSIVKDMKDKVIPAQRLAPHTIASGNLPGKMSYNEILSDTIFSSYNTTINSTPREDALALSAQAREESRQSIITTPHDERSPHHVHIDASAWWAHQDARSGNHRMAIHYHNEAIEHHQSATGATNSQEAKLAHSKAIDAHRIAIDAHKDADPTINAGQDAANAIVNAMESHHWDDWYDAILVASLDEVSNLYDAIGLANRAYTSHPKYESEPKEDDAEVVLGKWVKDESILANSTPREDATALSKQAYDESLAAQRVTPQELLHHAGNAVWMASQAHDYAGEGNSSRAIHHHNAAIQHHTQALEDNTWDKSIQAHQRAISTHRIAIDAHKDADTTINALTPGKEQALAVSRKADEDTLATSHQAHLAPSMSDEHGEARLDAGYYSFRARYHAEEGNPEQASHFHLLAARRHEAASNTTEHEASIQAHRNAATSHYIARDAHLDAVNNKRGNVVDNARLTESQQQARAVSLDAVASTNRAWPGSWSDRGGISGYSSNATTAAQLAHEASVAGRTGDAIRHHTKAIEQHEIAARLAENPRNKEIHQNAITAHKIARDAHTDAVNNKSADPDSYIKSNPNVIFSKYLTQAFTLGLGHTYDASKLTTPNHEDSKYHGVAKSEWLNDITQHPDTKGKLSGIISEGSKRLAGLDNMEDALRVGDTEILRSYGLGKELAKSRLLTVGSEKTKITRSSKVRNINNDIVANALSEGQQNALELTKESHKETHNPAMWFSGAPSEQTQGASNWTGHAYRYASRGQSEEAAKAHLQAAQYHEAAAKHPSLSDRPDVRELHTKAAQIHRIAADAHTDATINISKGGHSIGNPNSQPLYYWQMKPDDMVLLKNFSAVTNSIEVVKNMHDEETREATKGALAATQTAVKASRKLRMPYDTLHTAEHQANSAEIASRHSNGSRDALKSHEHAILAHEQASNQHLASVHDARKNKDTHREASNLHLEAASMHREAVAHYSDSGVGNWTNEARQASENAHYASQTAIQHSHNSGYVATVVSPPVERANSLRGYGAGVTAVEAHEWAARAHQYQTAEHDRNRVRLNNPASTTYSPDQATLHERATDAHRQAAHAHIRAAQAINDSMNRPLSS